MYFSIFPYIDDFELNSHNLRPPVDDADAKQALQKHLEIRKTAIESCMGVFRCSQTLFERLGTIRCGPHPTTSACKAVELPLIQVKLKCQKLDELSQKHGSHLQDCLTVAEFKQRYEEIKIIIDEAETKYFGKELVGSSLDETQNNLREINISERKIDNCIETLKSINSQLEILRATSSSDVIGLFKNEIEKLDSKSDHIVSILTNRRRTLKLAARFYALAVEAEIELEKASRLVESEPQRKIEFKEMADAKCVELLYLGHLLDSRIDSDQNETLREKLKLIETKLDSLKVDETTEKNSEEAVKKIKIWMQKVGEQIYIRECYMPEDLAAIHQFLIESKAISEEIKLKRTDLENIVSAPQLVEPIKSMAEESLKRTEELGKKYDWRSHSALSAIKLLKIYKQLLVKVDNMFLISKKELNENSTNHIEMIIKKIITEIEEYIDIAQAFIKDCSEGAKDAGLNADAIIKNIAFDLESLKLSKGKLLDLLENLKKRILLSNNAEQQWTTFDAETFKIISWIICTEEGFFPQICGQIGNTITEVKQLKKRLEDFQPTIEKMDEETSKLLKMAELASMRSVPTNYSKQMMHDLLKAHSRFTTRFNEYKYLLKMSEDFFENLEKLDKFLSNTEKQCQSLNLKKPVDELKKLKHDEDKRLKDAVALMLSAVDVANEVVIRVRQKNANAEAASNVRRLLEVCATRQQNMDEDWNKIKNQLEEDMILCQLLQDIKKLQLELDVLQKQLVCRLGLIASPSATVSSIEAIIETIKQLKELASQVDARVSTFVNDVDNIISNGKVGDVRALAFEIKETEKRWKLFHETIDHFLLKLADCLNFQQLQAQCCTWIGDCTTYLEGVRTRAAQCSNGEDVDFIIAEVRTKEKDGSEGQDNRIKEMNNISTQLHGPVSGPENMVNILTENNKLHKLFVQIIEELNILKNNLDLKDKIMLKMGGATGISSSISGVLPRFLQSLQNVQISQDQSLTLECHVLTDNEVYKFQWTKDNMEINNSWTITNDKGLLKLSKDKIRMEDAGNYKCHVTCDKGTCETVAIVTVTDICDDFGLRFLTPLVPCNVPIGANHTFECKLSYNTSDAKTLWSKDDRPISNVDHVVGQTGEGLQCLKLKKLGKEDSGVYKCSVVVDGKEIFTECELKVLPVVKPDFIVSPQDCLVNLGSHLILECRLVGFPYPQVYWFFDGKNIYTGPNIQIKTENNLTILEINHLTFANLGTYSIHASNIGGEAFASCLVGQKVDLPRPEVIKPPVVVEGTGCKPYFKKPLQFIQTEEGQSVKLECVVEGEPIPEVKWFHNDQPIRASKDSVMSHDKLSGSCELLLCEVFMEDAGEYVCSASNRIGHASTRARINVLATASSVSMEHEDEAPPKFTQLLNDVEAMEGELIEFECRVIGKPNPIIKWYHGRNLIENNKHYKISSDGTLQKLTIQCVELLDGGNFVVKANNNAGIAKCYATMTIKHASNHVMKMRLVESKHILQTSNTPGAPEILQSFRDVHVKSGEPCTMEVVIGGNPKPKITWLFNDEPIVSSDYKISTHGDVYRLHIREVFDEDAGKFTIVAENLNGKASCSCLLVVVEQSRDMEDFCSPPETPPVKKGGKAPCFIDNLHDDNEQRPVTPKFLTQLTNQSVSIGQPITFVVEVSGVPTPGITWYKGEKSILTDGRFKTSHKDGYASLFIGSVEEADGGEYKCVAANHLGACTHRFELIIKGTLRSSFQKITPPQLIEPMRDQKSNLSQPVMFRCKIISVSPANHKWFHNDVILYKDNLHFKQSKSGEVYILEVDSVDNTDAGLYKCVVSNEGGEVTCIAHLIIHSRQATVSPYPWIGVQLTAPHIFRPLTDVTARVGDEAKFEIGMRGQPMPKIMWNINGRNVVDQESTKMEQFGGDCSLRINPIEMWMFGQIKCYGSTNAGSVESSAMLHMIDHEASDLEIQQLVDSLGRPIPRKILKKEDELIFDF